MDWNQVQKIYTGIFEMVKFPKGPAHPHILQSHGADKNINKFYITETSNKFTRGYTESYLPRKGKHVGTGYSSNFRPQIYYTRSMDEIDNPVMARMCANNYASITTKHFKEYDTPSGKEGLPMTVHQKGTGFTREAIVTAPDSKTVKSVFADTRYANLPNDYKGKKTCHLQKRQAKDPIESENQNLGPSFMSTETSKQFIAKPLNGEQGDMSVKTLGPNEVSGFVHNKNIEPLTFHPDLCYKGNVPRWMTSRPTGISMFTTDYRPYGRPYGDERNPQITVGSDRGTGFTRETTKPEYVNKITSDAYDRADQMTQGRLDKMKKVDPTEYMNVNYPNNGTSTNKLFYRGAQRPAASYADRLARTDVGTKEMTGYAENHDTWAYSKDDPRRFTTHYSVKFENPTPVGKEREGFVQGGVQTMKEDGFTKSTKPHTENPGIGSTETLRRLAPYVSRSIKARDTFYDDHTYDHKQGLQRSVTVI